MSFYGNTDFLIEVAKGNVPGHSLVHKFGRNAAVPNGSWELISNLSGATSFLSAATTVRVKTGNAADTAAGAGAREITVQGVDDNLARVTEAIATAGASASSATTASFWRVDRAYVSSAGTYATPVNTGNVIIENSSGGTDLIQISAGEGQSQYGAAAVQTGAKAYLLSVLITIDSIQSADIRMFTRANFNDTTAPVSPQRIKLYWDGIVASVSLDPNSPIFVVDGPSDIWLEAEGAGGATEVSCDFELLIVDN